jgi:hypothetical protein
MDADVYLKQQLSSVRLDRRTADECIQRGNYAFPYLFSPHGRATSETSELVTNTDT